MDSRILWVDPSGEIGASTSFDPIIGGQSLQLSVLKMGSILKRLNQAFDQQRMSNSSSWFAQAGKGESRTGTWGSWIGNQLTEKGKQDTITIDWRASWPGRYSITSQRNVGSELCPIHLVIMEYHEHSCNINFAPFSSSLIKLRHLLYADNPTCPNLQIVQLKNNMKSQEENVAVCLKGQQEKLEKTLVELQECKTTAQEMRIRKVFLLFCHLFFKIVFFSNLSIPCLNDLRRDFIVEAFATKHQSPVPKAYTSISTLVSQYSRQTLIWTLHPLHIREIWVPLFQQLVIRNYHIFKEKTHYLQISEIVTLLVDC